MSQLIVTDIIAEMRKYSYIPDVWGVLLLLKCYI